MAWSRGVVHSSWYFIFPFVTPFQVSVQICPHIDAEGGRVVGGFRVAPKALPGAQIRGGASHDDTVYSALHMGRKLVHPEASM